MLKRYANNRHIESKTTKLYKVYNPSTGELQASSESDIIPSLLDFSVILRVMNRVALLVGLRASLG